MLPTINLTLPVPLENVTVRLMAWMPQRVFEAYNEALTAGMSMDIGGTQEVTDDDMLRNMGADFLQQYKNEQSQDKKDEMASQVRRKIAVRKVQAKFTMKDQHNAMRVKVLGMVSSIDNDGVDLDRDEDIEEFILDLPVNCYEAIANKVEEIENAGRENEKK